MKMEVIVAKMGGVKDGLATFIFNKMNHFIKYAHSLSNKENICKKYFQYLIMF